MKRIIIFSLVVIASISFVGCAKYDEGSNVSLISAKQRLINTWTMTKYEVNNVDQTANVPALEVVFYKDESFKRTLSAFITLVDKGTWVFADAKEYVVLTAENGNTEKFKIIKLKNKELKVESTNGSILRYTFVGK